MSGHCSLDAAVEEAQDAADYHGSMVTIYRKGTYFYANVPFKRELSMTNHQIDGEGWEVVRYVRPNEPA